MIDEPGFEPVASHLERFEASDPMGRVPDPWEEFRSIEILDLEWAHQYRHSLGKYSRFFLELEQGRLLATKCPQCATVWAPPRPVCPRDLATTGWVELPGTGTLAGFSLIHRTPRGAPALQAPYVLAYADLDGADTLFLHVLDVGGDLSIVTLGMDLRVAFNDGPVDHSIWLMRFVPADPGSPTSPSAENSNEDTDGPVEEH